MVVNAFQHAKSRTSTKRRRACPSRGRHEGLKMRARRFAFGVENVALRSGRKVA